MFLVRSAPATRRLAGRVRVAVVERNDTTGELGTRPGPGFLGHTTPFTRPPQAGELALQKPLAQRLSKRYDHQRRVMCILPGIVDPATSRGTPTS